MSNHTEPNILEPDYLKKLVQKMLDAGESEENIKKVVQHVQNKKGAVVKEDKEDEEEGKEEEEDSGEEWGGVATSRRARRVQDQEQQWSCSVCTFLNNFLLQECEMCSAPRPVEIYQSVGQI